MFKMWSFLLVIAPNFVEGFVSPQPCRPAAYAGGGLLQHSNGRRRRRQQQMETLANSLEGPSFSSIHTATTKVVTALSATAATTDDESTTNQNDATIGFYVHIPYCRQRCRYCDFAIVPIGNATVDTTSSNSSSTTSNATSGFAAMDLAYREALLQELDLIATDADAAARKTTTLSSIYFGGGTPSLAPVETIQAVLDKLKEHFILPDDIEITMEMDPGTFDETQLRSLHTDSGVNRVSLGVQSLQNDVLAQIGRVHRVDDIYEAVRILKNVGIDNYSIDLISGLPGVSLADWAETLEVVLRDFQPNHLSIYDLQVEQGTVFGKWYEDANSDDDDETRSRTTTTSPTKYPNLPSPDDSAYMYKYASGYLRHKGFEHYEISSYAAAAATNNKDSNKHQRSIHNQVYWAYDTSWYAIGLGATSFLQNHRFARPRAMADYISWVHTQGDKTSSVAQSERKFDWMPPVQELTASDDDDGLLVDEERLTDVILTRLRTKDGLDFKWLERAYSKDMVETVIRGAELGLDMGLAHLNDDRTLLRLVDPKGFLFSNYIISNIFVELGVEG